VWSERNDRASPRIDGNPVKWSVGIDVLTATHSFASPEIDPILVDSQSLDFRGFAKTPLILPEFQLGVMR